MSNPRILVVDDDHAILLLMKSLLREFGFEPITASSGTEALRIAAQSEFDLVLLDMHMPEMNGRQVIGALRGNGHADVPVLLLTGAPVDRHDLETLGANDAVQKPFDIHDLLGRIRRHLGAPSHS